MTRAGRIGLLLLLARWTWIFLVWPMRQDVIGDSFPHTISVPFHEAGHILFSPLGDLMTSFGGSLMQVLVPVACGAAFLTTSPNPFGAAAMAWWAGENLLDVAIYVNDARALQLVLLGGHTGAEVEGHDWEHILQLTGLLQHDHQIAWTAHVLGAVIMIGALIWGAIITASSRLDTENNHEPKAEHTDGTRQRRTATAVQGRGSATQIPDVRVNPSDSKSQSRARLCDTSAARGSQLAFVSGACSVVTLAWSI